MQTFGLFDPVDDGESDLAIEGARSIGPDDTLPRMQHEILDKLAAIPGVASVAFTSWLPMDDTSTRASDRV